MSSAKDSAGWRALDDCPSVAEHEHPAAKRVAFQHLGAEPGQPIDPLAEVRQLHGHQDAHLGSNLDHGSTPNKTLLTAVTTSGLWLPLTWMRIFAPRGSSSSTMRSGDLGCSGGVNSTNVIAGFF